jgi:hypothetical protein
MSDVEIKDVKATEVELTAKITLYCCVLWVNASVYAKNPSPWKENIEKYALKMTKKGYKCKIYKFEVDKPAF